MPAILAAKSLGLNCLGIDSNPSADGLFLCDEKIICKDLEDTSYIFDFLEDRAISPAGVISYCSDAGQLLSARLRQHYGLSGDDLETTMFFLDKAKQREVWDKKNSQSLEWRSFTDVDSAKEYAYGNARTLVIKPADSSGSRGVNIISRHSEEEISKAIREAFKNSKNKKIVVEEFIEGVEYTVDAFSLREEFFPLLITRKKNVSDGLRTVASELQVLPKSHELHARISDFVRGAVSSLGKKTGPSHSEVFVRPDGEIQMVESASRGGGFNLASRFVPMVSGVNYPLVCIKECLGELSQKELRVWNYDLQGSLRFLVANQGIVTKVDGFDNNRVSNNCFVEAFVKEGDVLSNPSTDADRTGCLIATAQTLEQLESTMERLEKEVEIEIS